MLVSNESSRLHGDHYVKILRFIVDKTQQLLLLLFLVHPETNFAETTVVATSSVNNKIPFTELSTYQKLSRNYTQASQETFKMGTA